MSVMASTELKFRIEAAERSIEASVRVPADPIRPHELLPIILPFTDAVVGLSEAASRDRGDEVSCRAGCCACCRQLVPVSEHEAAHLAAVVQALPEHRRDVLKQRFRTAGERSAEVLRRVRKTSGEDRVAAIAEAANSYFQLRIPCPFLEDRTCSIYEDRPAVCREYLVTSSPEHCETLDLERTKRVPVPVTVSSTLIYFGEAEPKAIPLIDVLDWAETTFLSDVPPAPGDVLFRQFLQLFYESPSRLE
jgi:Fe-S-cluster containining protein